MPFRKNSIKKLVAFSPDEWLEVCEKASYLHMRVGTYIRKIAVQGEIKNYNMSELNSLKMSFNRIGIELNQIAKVANSTQSVYQKDIEDMKKEMDYFRRVMKNYLHELEPNVIL